MAGLMDTERLEKILRRHYPFGFHLTQELWDALDIRTLVGATPLRDRGADTQTVRRLAVSFGRWHGTGGGPTPWIQPGDLISAGVITDILRYVFHLYCQQQFPGVLDSGQSWIDTDRPSAKPHHTAKAFVDLFPPRTTMLENQTADDYVQQTVLTIPNRHTVIGEILLLSLSLQNSAFRPFTALFADDKFREQAPAESYISAWDEYFDRQPVFDPLGETLIACLGAPAKAAPDSLEGQLQYLREHWAVFLPPDLLERLTLATDIIREERAMRGFGPGPIEALRFGPGYGDEYGGLDEPERFSHDADWMSNVVLIAKSIYIWLDQLSRKYQRHIKQLDEIPDEELDLLARWGFSGLWLIGVWQRSPASQKIKQIMGNPEAAPSAYSVYDYVIADELGGEDAYHNLRDRALQRGIRLASDMVPNHMGIYSKWVIEHPDWFLQGDHPPYPWYQYTGVDVSEDDRVVLQIEDGYWEHRDAAVVFKRIDKWTGDAKFIYHGNDGTNMPWNDTAQLNFLNPEVREAVIQTIVHVARQFPIIRFDAAMTLAKKHYQRLWFPKPGDGGSIPSRAEFGMTRDEFDKHMPEEFWREVVERVATEVPDTLLLAEAFWLMEGYFVRTLGMHRVYNSAFMNMLKMEDNSKYRLTVKNVLEFSPEVLKRFVNFMNNPDEETAIAQFGTGDKYFGVALMMVTMPGLPMFGHGQIEGLTEKYGMEYRRAYWDEQPDEDMVRRHEREIFPLMRRRYLFSGAANFALYDFVTPDGWVDENVFAYSNRVGQERGVILYNNAYNSTRGQIKRSTAINTGSAEETNFVRRTLGEALALKIDANVWYSFRDHRDHQEYLRSGAQLSADGIFAELGGYQYHAFLDFREHHDQDGSWATLAQRLNGAPVPSIDDAYREMLLDPVLIPFRKLIEPERMHTLRDGKIPEDTTRLVGEFYQAAITYSGVALNLADTISRIEKELKHFTLEEFLAEMPEERWLSPENKARFVAAIGLPIRYLWCICRNLWSFQPTAPEDQEVQKQSNPYYRWLLPKQIRLAFISTGRSEHDSYIDTMFLTALLEASAQTADHHLIKLGRWLNQMFNTPAIAEYLQVNEYDDVLWLNRERLHTFILACAVALTVRIRAAGGSKVHPLADHTQTILDAAEEASYQVDQIITRLKS